MLLPRLIMKRWKKENKLEIQLNSLDMYSQSKSETKKAIGVTARFRWLQEKIT